MKIASKPEEIIFTINQEIANSENLDNDCRVCMVKSIRRVSPQEKKALGRNWCIDWIDSHNWSSCETSLIPIIKSVGDRYEADWD
jgi:hypothetical protein